MKNCLIVDDSAMDRKLLTVCITRLGLNCLEASSPWDAITICKNKLPDCILLDWEMPDINGIEVLQKIRQLENGYEPVIIICTAHGEPNYIGHAIAKGAHDYIVKPITPDRLQEKFREHGILPE